MSSISPEIYISNATPANFPLGTNDLSTVAQTPVDLPRPELMPFFPFYSERGRTEAMVMDGASFVKEYGDKTLDINSPYFNHATLHLKGVLEDAGTIVAQRIIPEGADKLASMRVSIEFVEVNVPEYVRDTSGQFARDFSGRLQTTCRTVPGVIYKYVVEEVPTTEVLIGGQTIKTFEFGTGAERAGDLVVDGNVSKRIPLLDFAVSSPGAWGNLTGISIWAPTTIEQSAINRVALADTNSYPFRLSVRYKTSASNNVNVVETTIKGARDVDFTLKPKSVSKAGVRYYLGDTFVETYNNTTPDNPNTPATIGRFNRCHVYQQNIDMLLEKFTIKETDQEQIADFTSATVDNRSDLKYLFNLFTGKHTDGRPYQTFRLGDLGTNGTIMGETVTLWCKGGTDGVMNDQAFAQAVEALMERFADKNDRFMDDVTYNDSTFVDSGYPLETKLVLGKYISTRHDRWLLSTTHVDGEEVITPAEANARAAMLRAAYRNYPDSTLFGTDTYRAIIVKGSCRLLASVLPYHKRIPQSYELLRKLTKYWGASSGKANKSYDLVEGDNQYFDYTTDISDPWVPYQTRNEAWASGAMWAELSERKTPYFPMYRTIYNDDSSTLMNVRVMLVHVALNKIGANIRRRFSGKDWSQLRFKEEIESYFYQQVGDSKFGGKVYVSGEVQFTTIDNERGWSWKFVGRVYGDNFRTVQVTWTENYRASDLPSEFTGVLS